MNISLPHTAVYWARLATQDGFSGWNFSDPVEINCRWEDNPELFLDAKGERQISKSIVYITESIQNGGYLFLGELTDLASSSVSPHDVEGAWEIRSHKASHDLSGNNRLLKVWL